MPDAAPDLKSGLPLRAFIDGKPVEGTSGEWSPLVYPGNEEEIGRVADASAADVDAAVRAARREMEPGSAWSKVGPNDRQRILLRLAQALRDRADEVARLETLNTGKPLQEAKLVDVAEAVSVLEYFAGWATKVHGETLPDRPGAFLYTRREPVGVVGAIVPWNFPLDLAVWKVAPAIASGCCIVLKPAPGTPCSVLRLAEMAVECGLPAGVFSVVPGSGPGTGAALVRHPGVDKVAFTGSTAVGKWVAAECAAQVKRCTLELGGKSPNIVLADADLEAAARGAAVGIFYNKGEVCAAGSRLLVEDAVHDALLEKLLARAAKMQPGDPFHPKTRMGPVVSRVQMDRVLGYIEKGKAEGARLVAGGGPARVREDGKGFYVQPTVFDEVDNERHAIAREEIFGPVLSVLRVKDADDAVRVGNRTMYGLAAAVWSRDVKKALRVAHGLRAGTVWVNAYNMYDPALPFGGFGQSGFGRELGSTALEAYTEVKSVWVDLA